MNRGLPAPWRRFDSAVITVINLGKSGLPRHNSFSVRTRLAESSRRVSNCRPVVCIALAPTCQAN